MNFQKEFRLETSSAHEAGEMCRWLESVLYSPAESSFGWHPQWNIIYVNGPSMKYTKNVSGWIGYRECSYYWSRGTMVSSCAEFRVLAAYWAFRSSNRLKISRNGKLSSCGTSKSSSRTRKPGRSSKP